MLYRELSTRIPDGVLPPVVLPRRGHADPTRARTLRQLKRDRTAIFAVRSYRIYRFFRLFGSTYHRSMPMTRVVCRLIQPAVKVQRLTDGIQLCGVCVLMMMITESRFFEHAAGSEIAWKCDPP